MHWETMAYGDAMGHAPFPEAIAEYQLTVRACAASRRRSW